MDLYREQLLEHYHHPHGWGLKAAADRQEQGVNNICGDQITIQLQLAHDQITAMRFEAQGCVISRAAASLLSEYVAGKKIADVAALSLAQVESLLGTQVPPGRVQCALLPLTTIHRALQQKGS